MSARYTAAERRQRAVLVLRGSRQALAGAQVPGGIDRAIDRIDARATDRYARESAAALDLVDKARTAAAKARAALQAADRADKPQAKTALKRAEDALKRAERAAAKYLHRP